MTINQVHKENNKCQYVITITTNRWYHIFDRYERWEILADSLRYCQKRKGLKIYGYVFMINHIHMIIQFDDVAGFLRDFKPFRQKNSIISQARGSLIHYFKTKFSTLNLKKNGRTKFLAPFRLVYPHAQFFFPASTKIFVKYKMFPKN